MADQTLNKFGSRELKAEKREILGRKVKKLRREGVLPANIYGKKVKSQAVQVSLTDFKKVFSEVGETGLVELKVNGATNPVLIHNVQADPVTDEPIHADFLQVDLKEKVSATVPLEFTGESPAEKTGEGIVVHQMNEIEVEALPMDLPDHISVDISGLEAVDDAIHVKNLNVDTEKIELKEDPERIVVNVAPPAKEEEVVPPPEGEVVPEEVAPEEAVEEKVEGAPAKEGEAPEKKAEEKPSATAEDGVPPSGGKGEQAKEGKGKEPGEEKSGQ